MPAPGQGQFYSDQGTLGRWSTEAPDDWDWSGDSDGMWPVSRLRQAYIDYLSAKMLEYQEQQQARHYYHGAQWTPEEIRVLRSRRQPIITFNDSGRKIDGIVGVVQRIRTDPKAFPRDPKNADGAEIATECVRAVLDSCDWEFLDEYCANQCAIEGIGGIELKLVDGDHADPDVTADFIFGDDFFYDPRSFKPDFSDARYMGIAKWLDVEAAVELFPDKEDQLRTLMVETGFDLTTHSDREYKWVYVNEKRLRLVEIWYKYRGRWHWAFFCSMILLDQGVSPFLDERNKPMNRFIMWSAYIDHDGDRYGFSRNLKGPQDEVNQRRSKALFMSNTSRAVAKKGAVDDVEKARREYARPDGWVEINPGFENPEPIDKTSDLANQLSLMQDARGWINSYASVMPDSLRQDEPTEHSGVAINYLQKAGIAELGPFLRNYKNWKKRVYRAIWNIAQRTWTNERFIRTTNNQGLTQFIQVNGQSKDQWGRPVWVNAIGNLNVEMTMDEGPDESNIMTDAYDVLKQQPPGTVPPQVLIELSPLSSKMKQRVLALMQAPVDPLAQQAKVIALQKEQAGAEELKARAQRHGSQIILDAARAAHLSAEAQLMPLETFAKAVGRADQGGASQQQQQPSQPQQFGDWGGQPANPGGAPPMQQGPGLMQPGPGPMQRPQMPQPRRAPDGRHYLPDPRRPGKYLMVA